MFAPPNGACLSNIAGVYFGLSNRMNRGSYGIACEVNQRQEQDSMTLAFWSCYSQSLSLVAVLPESCPHRIILSSV
jgi:hypothetical protein